MEYELKSMSEEKTFASPESALPEVDSRTTDVFEMIDQVCEQLPPAERESKQKEIREKLGSELSDLRLPFQERRVDLAGERRDAIGSFGTKLKDKVTPYLAEGIFEAAMMEDQSVSSGQVEVVPERRAEKEKTPLKVELTGLDAAATPERMQSFFQETLPAGWAEELSEVVYVDYYRLTKSKMYSEKMQGNIALGATSGGVREKKATVMLYAHLKDRPSDQWMEVLLHETAHANDWEKSATMDEAERKNMRDKISARLDKKDRFKSSYVEDILAGDIPDIPRLDSKDQLKSVFAEQIEADKKNVVAREYWAELCRAYLDGDETSLKDIPAADMAILKGYFRRVDPNFNQEKARQGRTELSRQIDAETQPIATRKQNIKRGENDQQLSQIPVFASKSDEPLSVRDLLLEKVEDPEHSKNQNDIADRKLNEFIEQIRQKKLADNMLYYSVEYAQALNEIRDWKAASASIDTDQPNQNSVKLMKSYEDNIKYASDRRDKYADHFDMDKDANNEISEKATKDFIQNALSGNIDFSVPLDKDIHDSLLKRIENSGLDQNYQETLMKFIGAWKPPLIDKKANTVASIK